MLILTAYTPACICLRASDSFAQQSPSQPTVTLVRGGLYKVQDGVESAYRTHGTIALGDSRVELVHPSDAHARDLTVLYLPAERIVFAGNYWPAGFDDAVAVSRRASVLLPLRLTFVARHRDAHVRHVYVEAGTGLALTLHAASTKGRPLPRRVVLGVLPFLTL